MFGNLTWAAFPTNIIDVVTAIVLGIIVVGIAAALTWFGKWRYLWEEWLTSLDHKKIGIMYLVLAHVMLLRGFADAIMMRTQLAMATGGAAGYLEPEHYDQIFSAHGTIMIFFVAMPFMIGLMNFIIPLQIGARDVAFPYLNSISLWLSVAGAMLVNVSLVVGDFSRTGWLAYAPLSGAEFSPDEGVDYWTWAVQIGGVGTLLSGINFFVTIVKMRAPGMTWMRLPVFIWTSLTSSMLIMAAFPILTATLAMLSLDRYLGMHFFTNDMGGDPMLYVSLIWAWGHPEVYILILPAFGVFSEVVATFSGKSLFGYRSMVYATLAIAGLSFLVWLHHFFTMGAGANVNAFFGVMTMVIAVPTGVKVFNWLFTMYGGRIRYSTPMLWAIAFMVTFTIGGMTGVILSFPAADFVLHNSLFQIAHFHNMLIGGMLFGFFSGFAYWFPKIFGFRLHEGLGRWAFGFWVSGFYLAFMPLYALGFFGMTRRLQHTENPEWSPYLWVALAGAILIAIGIATQILQLIVSIRQREKNLDLSGDPWDGRMLEWATPSPPPEYNFARLPDVMSGEPFWDAKRNGNALFDSSAHHELLDLPRNTGAGLVVGVLAGLAGFAMAWHIWWLVIASLLAMLVVLIVRGNVVAPHRICSIDEPEAYDRVPTEEGGCNEGDR